MNFRTAHHQAGFSVIEALVAFVVVAFGMLGLAGMQLSLSRSADIAKQRTEAMRLAQDKMEALRSFTGISTGTVNWNGLTSGSDSISSYTVGGTAVPTNATYTRSWTLGGTVNDTQRSLNVVVSWTDRASAPQSVTLSSVMAKVNPSDVDFLLYPLPENTNLKRPKNRNLNIPIQATPIGNTGKSAINMGGFSVVFDNVNGYVVKSCNVNSVSVTDLSNPAVCPNYNAYILAGYVSGAVSNGASGVATAPTGVNFSGISGYDTSRTIVCAYGQAKNQNDNTTLISGFQYYLCVIPMSLNGTWSGTVRLGGVPVNSNYKVCRVQYASSDFVDSNDRNVQPYSGVGKSLDNQNYYIVNSSGNTCPTIGTDLSSEGVTNGQVATQLHQDCRSAVSPSASAAGTCPATAYNAPPSAPSP